MRISVDLKQGRKVNREPQEESLPCFMIALFGKSPKSPLRKSSPSMLTQETRCLCNGFFISGHPDYLFLNDSISEDGFCEFGIVRGGLEAQDRCQVESITFSWCTEKKALSYIRRALAGGYDKHAWPVAGKVETPRQHGTCGFCA